MVLEAEEEGVRISRSETRLVEFCAVVEPRAVMRKSGSIDISLECRSWMVPARRCLGEVWERGWVVTIAQADGRVEGVEVVKVGFALQRCVRAVRTR